MNLARSLIILTSMVAALSVALVAYYYVVSDERVTAPQVQAQVCELATILYRNTLEQRNRALAIFEPRYAATIENGYDHALRRIRSLPCELENP